MGVIPRTQLPLSMYLFSPGARELLAGSGSPFGLGKAGKQSSVDPVAIRQPTNLLSGFMQASAKAMALHQPPWVSMKTCPTSGSPVVVTSAVSH